MPGDAEDWATARVAALRDSGKDPGARVGFLRTSLSFHPNGSIAGTVHDVPIAECVVVRSDGGIEKEPIEFLTRNEVEEKDVGDEKPWSTEVFFATELKARKFGASVKEKDPSAYVEIWGPVTE